MVTVPKPGKRSTDLFWNGGSGGVKISEGRCRMCQRPRTVRPLTRHHLVPLRFFMSYEGQRYRIIRNSNANIVPLCRLCHDLIEDRDQIARKMLRRLLTQQEIAFIVRVRGIGWMNSVYPLSDERRSTQEVHGESPGHQRLLDLDSLTPSEGIRPISTGRSQEWLNNESQSSARASS